MNAPLNRPLVFGDAEQIEALREAEHQAEMKSDWEKIADCKECDGGCSCDKCGNDCPDCDGSGKEYRGRESFHEKYGVWHP